MRQSRQYGSVRGVISDGHPYRDPDRGIAGRNSSADDQKERYPPGTIGPHRFRYPIEKRNTEASVFFAVR